MGGGIVWAARCPFQRQRAASRWQPALAAGTEPRHHGALPAGVGELVEAAVAPAAEDLKHVLAPAALALRRPRCGRVRELASGRARGTASARKRPSSSTQRRASSRAWARNASRRATKSPKRSAIRWCVPAAPPSAALARALIERKPATSAGSPTGSSREPQPGHRSPTRSSGPAALYRRVLQATHLKMGHQGRFRSVSQASIHDN